MYINTLFALLQQRTKFTSVSSTYRKPFSKLDQNVKQLEPGGQLNRCPVGRLEISGIKIQSIVTILLRSNYERRIPRSQVPHDSCRHLFTHTLYILSPFMHVVLGNQSSISVEPT